MPGTRGKRASQSRHARAARPTSARALALASGGHRAITRNKDAARRRGGHRRPCKYPPRIGRASLNHEEVTARARGSPSHRPASTFSDQPGFRRTPHFVTSPNQVARDQRFCVRPVAATSRRPAGAAACKTLRAPSSSVSALPRWTRSARLAGTGVSESTTCSQSLRSRNSARCLTRLLDRCGIRES
jgi:hypothetical protein